MWPGIWYTEDNDADGDDDKDDHDAKNNDDNNVVLPVLVKTTPIDTRDACLLHMFMRLYNMMGIYMTHSIHIHVNHIRAHSDGLHARGWLVTNHCLWLDRFIQFHMYNTKADVHAYINTAH